MKTVHSAAGVLQLVRDETATDWQSLKRFWLVASRTVKSDNEDLYQLLIQLRKLGLIACKGDFRQDGQIEITKRCSQTLSVLGISLTSLIHVQDGTGLTVTPYFRPPRDTDEFPNVIVVMSFEPKLEPVYSHISKVVHGLKLTVQRADDITAPNVIMEDVWERICGARAVIADCTGSSPNVFYEIGLAHAIGTPVILITQNKRYVPFDLRHNRYLEYEYPSRAIMSFKRRLENTLVETLKLEAQPDGQKSKNTESKNR